MTKIRVAFTDITPHLARDRLVKKALDVNKAFVLLGEKL
jgi:hypothetical protein